MGFWSKFADIAKTVGPVVLSVVPGVPPTIAPLIVHGIAVAEMIPGADGATKKAAVLALVNDGLASLNAARGETVVDPAIIADSVGKGIDAVVATVNQIQKAHAEDAAESAAGLSKP